MRRNFQKTLKRLVSMKTKLLKNKRKTRKMTELRKDTHNSKSHTIINMSSRKS